MTPTPKSLKAAKLVMAAIADSEHDKGLTVEGIAHHIEDKFSVPNSEFSRHLAHALKKGKAFGAIKERGGKYYLGDVMDDIKMHRRRRRRSKKGGLGRRRRRRHRSRTHDDLIRTHRRRRSRSKKGGRRRRRRRRSRFGAAAV